MPIPILLAGLGVAAGVLGAGGHLSAKETNEKAQRISQDAQDLYNNSKRALELAQNKTEKALLKLGYEKKNVLESSMRQFLTYYEKVKQIQLTESVGINELSKFSIDQQDAIELRQMTDIYSTSIKSGATGAAAGTIIALAASGSLTVVTGGLATAGSYLIAGEIGTAAGIAGSALSAGAAMTPLAAIAAPVILFTGISASMKADENLEKANTMYAEAEAASEKMKLSETLCDAITDRSKMFDDLLVDLNKMFAECSSLMAGVIKKKEGRFLKKRLTAEDFTQEELNLIGVTRSLAGAIKSVIDTPILSKDGNISYDAETVYERTITALPDFSHNIEVVKSIDYNIKPIGASVSDTSNTHSQSHAVASGTTILSGIRNVFAFVLGFIVATTFADDMAYMISDNFDKFLFMNSFVANKIALWLLICASLTMLVGRLKNSKVEKICSLGSGIAIWILYVQYCRTVERMEHYIIFSIVAFVILSVLYSFFDGKKDKWQFGLFMSLEFICMGMCPFLFLIYAFFSKLIGFSEGACLIVTSILMLFISVSGMLNKD